MSTVDPIPGLHQKPNPRTILVQSSKTPTLHPSFVFTSTPEAPILHEESRDMLELQPRRPLRDRVLDQNSSRWGNTYMATVMPSLTPGKSPKAATRKEFSGIQTHHNDNFLHLSLHPTQQLHHAKVLSFK
ncbi:hypothetical protein M758_12G100500 [Ceratodon purpureus]|nr:hypothetical protein M758_12G100500 [Ceratodon purpureus]